MDKTDLLVVHDLHGPGHQAEATQCVWGENKASREHSQVYKWDNFKVKELDSIIHSTEFDIPMFIQEYDMSINGLRYYQPWARKCMLVVSYMYTYTNNDKLETLLGNTIHP